MIPVVTVVVAAPFPTGARGDAKRELALREQEHQDAVHRHRTTGAPFGLLSTKPRGFSLNCGVFAE
jgi:hypothetical protein